MTSDKIEAKAPGEPVIALPSTSSVTPLLGALFVALQLPPKELQPNARAGRWDRIKAVKSYRQAAKVAALNVRRANGNVTLQPPVQLDIAFYFSLKRARDEDNLIASLKPALDGLVDSKLIQGDDSDRLRINSITVEGHPALKPSVVLKLWTA